MLIHYKTPSHRFTVKNRPNEFLNTIRTALIFNKAINSIIPD
ncbi:hypothetical protein [Neisseria meningitidis]|nr:hypothetical protein [Neisseria meningitidis]